jgi:undecaprenyl-diphosphatase
MTAHPRADRTLAQVRPMPSDHRLPSAEPVGAGEAIRAWLHSSVGLILGFVALILAGWGAGELWRSIVGTIELDAMRDLAADRSGALTSIARTVTWAGSAFLLVPLGLVCCLVLVRRGLTREALILATSLAGAIGLAVTVKLLVERPRPPVEHLQAVSGPSFPSEHATQASAFWFSLALVLPAAGLVARATRLCAGLAVGLVLAVAASRVYLGVHYPADVIAGILLGTAWAVWSWRAIRTPRRPRADGGS